ncbi:MAG: hypothetical protein AB7T31_10085 [Gemmatimonadales bacterium]
MRILAPLLATVSLVVACRPSDVSRSTPESMPSEAPPALAAPRTPGMCGWWEEMDASAMERCRSLALRASGPPPDSLFPGACGFYQVVHLDSLRACLDRSALLAAECPLVGSWGLRHSDGQVRRAEWRRCGPESPEWRDDQTVYPRHHVLLRADDGASSPAVFALDNVDLEGMHGFEDVTAADLDGDGTDELFFVDAIYGTGAMFETCALTERAGRILCWSGPDFALDTLALGLDETLRKGWIPVSGPPTGPSDAGSFLVAPGRSLWFFTPIYAPDDPNCCSSLNASLWLEARPMAGRFQTGMLLRAREDEIGNVLSVDTLRR